MREVVGKICYTAERTRVDSEPTHGYRAVGSTGLVHMVDGGKASNVEAINLHNVVSNFGDLLVHSNLPTVS